MLLRCRFSREAPRFAGEACSVVLYRTAGRPAVVSPQEQYPAKEGRIATLGGLKDECATAEKDGVLTQTLAVTNET